MSSSSSWLACRRARSPALGSKGTASRKMGYFRQDAICHSESGRARASKKVELGSPIILYSSLCKIAARSLANFRNYALCAAECNLLGGDDVVVVRLLHPRHFVALCYVGRFCGGHPISTVVSPVARANLSVQLPEPHGLQNFRKSASRNLVSTVARCS